MLRGERSEGRAYVGAQHVLCQRLRGHFMNHKVAIGFKDTKVESSARQSVRLHFYHCDDCADEYDRRLLIESDVGALHLVHLVVRDGRPQGAAPLAQHHVHGTGQLRRGLLIPSLHHANLCPAASLPVPDVLSQQDCLQRHKGSALGIHIKIPRSYCNRQIQSFLYLPMTLWYNKCFHHFKYRRSICVAL